MNRIEGKPLQAVDLGLNAPEDNGGSLTDEQLEKRIAKLTEKLGLKHVRDAQM